MTRASRNRGGIGGALLVASILLAVAGCQSARVEDLVPQAGVRNTNTFPDLNVRPEVAGEQLTGSEANATVRSLEEAKARAAGQGGSDMTSSEDQLRKLSQKQDETRKQIEGGE